MQSLNRFTLLGNVGCARQSDTVVTVTIATNRISYDPKEGRKEETNWAQVTVMKPRQTEWVVSKVKKGDRVFVEGYISHNAVGSGSERKFVTDLIVESIVNFEGGGT